MRIRYQRVQIVRRKGGVLKDGLAVRFTSTGVHVQSPDDPPVSPEFAEWFAHQSKSYRVRFPDAELACAA